MSDKLRKCQKVYSDCITISAGRHHIAILAVQHNAEEKRFTVDLKLALRCFLSLLQLFPKLALDNKKKKERKDCTSIHLHLSNSGQGLEAS